MAGGKGERFWPLSTASHPKQVLALVGEKPMLAMMVDYVKELIPPERILIITSLDLAGVTREAVPMLPAENVIGEPVGRDTAAACALGAALVKAKDPEAAFCILTADHVIGRLELFRATLREGLRYAMESDVLITFGIRPTFPSTGFGYLEAGEEVKTAGNVRFRRVRRFVEKPNRETAERYLAAECFFWNSGMFIWSVKAFEQALARYCPDLMRMAQRIAPVAWTPGFAARLAEEYSKLGRISVDYAIMEKAQNIVMVQSAFAWDDVGSWPALANHLPPDAAGNVALGKCEALDSANNVVVSRERLTALIGIRDLVVVHAGNATLICPKDRAQDVKAMVQHLRGKEEYRELL
jgi:mannose-1-phosphate guanylyltransferase